MIDEEGRRFNQISQYARNIERNVQRLARLIPSATRCPGTKSQANISEVGLKGQSSQL